MTSDTMSFIREHKIITIVRSLNPEAMEALADALLAGGVRLMEVTFDQARPETWRETADAIRRIGRRHEGRMLIGAGTVLTPDQLHIAADAGARYIISPNADVSVIQETKRLGLVSLPGALTPTEIMAAWQAGADAVKIFPADNLGLAYIKAVRAPLAHVPMLAVGGVDEKNCAAFLAAGCSGVGVGGSLVNKQWIANDEFEKIETLARTFVQALAQ